MIRDWDVVVIGLGGFGSAATYWLSRRFRDRVLGLEQFELGHVRGASQDHSRIIRLSYHRPDYVRLARRAYESWGIVEGEAGVQIVTRTGGLDLFPARGAIPEADYAESMAAEGVSFDRLDAAEAMRRWPQWRLDHDTIVVHQAESGLADPNRGNAAHRRQAVANGATLQDRTRVVALRGSGGDIEIETEAGDRIETGHVVIAADAWTNPLLRAFDRQLPLAVTKEQVTYIASPDPSAFSPERFPIWIWMDDPCYYGFPTYGEPGPKVAQDVGGELVDPDTRDFDRDDAAFERAMSFVERRLPTMTGPPLLTKTCLYTLTPDRDFVLDRLPDEPRVHVALGAAHGFKFASLFGRILAERIADGSSPSDPDLERFRIDRPILLERDPATSYMV